MRVLKYGNHKLQVEEGVTLTEVRESMADLFPETADAVFTEDAEGRISVVLRRDMLQNQLDIELNKQRMLSTEQITVGSIMPERVPRERLSTRQAIDKARRETRYFTDSSSMTIHSNYGYTPATARQKRAHRHPLYEMARLEAQRETADYIHATLNDRLNQLLKASKPPLEYPYLIGDQYAERGSYTHLVGKRAKSVLYDELIGIHLVLPEGEEKEYVIRESDLTLEE